MPRTSTTQSTLFSLFHETVKMVDYAPLSPGGGHGLRYVDMFCGIGGFHVAADSLGMRCVFACDIDPDARKAYTHNHGIAPASDICALEPSEVPDHDVMLAGFPCQPFSIMGYGDGFEDARGTLFFELAKIIDAKNPRMVVLENVRQLVTHNNGKTLRRILEILRDLGYGDPRHNVFNALHFGLPQKRERVLIVAYKGGTPVDFTWPQRDTPMRPLSEILEKNPDRKHYVSDRISRARRAAHRAKIRPAIWHENKAGNVSSHAFSCALRAGASYNYLLVDGERRLTPREMLRLQGFPDSFEIVCTDSQTRKQAGNAVPVPMVRAVLEKAVYALRAKTKRSSQAA